MSALSTHSDSGPVSGQPPGLGKPRSEPSRKPPAQAQILEWVLSNLFRDAHKLCHPRGTWSLCPALFDCRCISDGLWLEDIEKI